LRPPKLPSRCWRSEFEARQGFPELPPAVTKKINITIETKFSRDEEFNGQIEVDINQSFDCLDGEK